MRARALAYSRASASRWTRSATRAARASRRPIISPDWTSTLVRLVGFPTNEEFAIARQAVALVSAQNR